MTKALYAAPSRVVPSNEIIECDDPDLKAKYCCLDSNKGTVIEEDGTVICVNCGKRYKKEDCQSGEMSPRLIALSVAFRIREQFCSDNKTK